MSSFRRVSISTAEALAKEEIMERSGFRNSKHFQPLMVAFLCFGFATFLSVYMMYYMKIFLDVYHISTDWIRIVQALFLVWNAVNDPLMGYFQDFGLCGMSWIMDRRKVIMYCSPVFAFSYLIFWFPWSTTNTVVTGLHLLFGLFLFDTLLTLVLSAYCGILVETCGEHSQRVRCLVYADLFGILGGSIIFPLNIYSNEAKNFERFQIGAAIIAVIGAAVMSAGAYFITPKRETETHDEIEIGFKNSVTSKDDKDQSFKSALLISWQIIREPRFLCLVGTGFMRSLRTVATGSFLIIIIQALVSRPGFMESGSPALSFYYAIIRPISSILFMSLWKPLSMLGTHKMMLIILIVALANVITAMIIGRGFPLAVLIYIAIEQVCATTGEHSFSMLLSGEVIDTDTKTHKRTSPLSTLIFTLKALFTKPAEQLSPLIFITLLERGGFTAYRGECITAVDNSTNSTELLTTATTLASPMTTASPTISNDFLFSNATLLPDAVEEPHCTILLDTMHSSMLYFTLFCTLAEIIIVSTDYWYKRRVLHEEDKKTNPLEIPLNEEEFVKKHDV